MKFIGTGVLDGFPLAKPRDPVAKLLVLLPFVWLALLEDTFTGPNKDVKGLMSGRVIELTRRLCELIRLFLQLLRTGLGLF